MHTYNILAFAGSLRSGSYNKMLLNTAVTLAPEQLSIEVFDIKDIPLYNGDVEAQGIPASVQLFKDKIAAADGVLIVTPEYNYSIPGVLKNALDWASRPPQNVFLEKPVALMGASDGHFGTARVQIHLKQTLTASLGAYVLPKPDVFVPKAQNAFDTQGNLLVDRTQEDITKLFAAYARWISFFTTSKN